MSEICEVRIRARKVYEQAPALDLLQEGVDNFFESQLIWIVKEQLYSIQNSYRKKNCREKEQDSRLRGGAKGRPSYPR